ncbi:MAG TPA: M67 family metallopeptidase [Gemmataceae bacterium]|nr:M67 family metallopeptidase [Gemmataceae bacterium]
MSTPFRLQVPRGVVEEMLAQAQAELPNECVGLLAGQVTEEGGRRLGRVVARYPLVNAAASPREYLSDPASMFAAHKDMRRRGLDVLAIYHSHPTSEAVPSRTDLARNYSAEVVNFIISLAGAEPQVRGWWLTDSDYREAEWDCAG